MGKNNNKNAEIEDKEEEIEFKDVNDIYEYYMKQREERKEPPEKLKIVMLDGKEVAFNPEEEEDPRLVKVIMEAEKEPTIRIDDTNEFFRKLIEEEDEDKD